MNNNNKSLPKLDADLVLLHAPAFFDFRNRKDIYFPFLGTSGDVPITPLYEYFPIGYKSLHRYLSAQGFNVKIINLSTVFLRYPKLDFSEIIKSLNVKLVGIDLHWMVHVQGSMAVAEEIKNIRPDIYVIFGGISSTYYAEELIEYPFIDFVMKGYDTHEPMISLLKSLKKGQNLNSVPNLLWKSKAGNIYENNFSYKPESFSCGIDWSNQTLNSDNENSPILEFLSTQNAGCSYNCGWCGGSRNAFRRIFRKKRTMARKSIDEIKFEFKTLNDVSQTEKYHFYSVGSYNESAKRMDLFLDEIEKSNLKSISYEQFHLTPEKVMKRMVEANKRTLITLSPESHDLHISKLAGRGVYTNEQLEEWLHKALAFGIYQIDIWYFVGMPEQDEKSVMESVEYCQRLLDLFKDKRVNPMICPMIPFLDPASTFFEQPEMHGYKIFYRSLAEHRSGMMRASLINRINYETKWLSRHDLVHVGFKSVRELMKIKAELGFLPKSVVKDYVSKIDDALYFIDVVHEVDCIADEKIRIVELGKLGDDILKRNNMIFFSGVMNQAYPINRGIGGRWFDEFGWDKDLLDKAQIQ